MIIQKLDILVEFNAIVYIEGPQVIFSEKMHSFNKDRFCLSKQCRLLSNANLGLRCLPKYGFRSQ